MTTASYDICLSHRMADAMTLEIMVNQPLVNDVATARMVGQHHWQIVALGNGSASVATPEVQQAIDQLMRRVSDQVRTVVIRPVQQTVDDECDYSNHCLFTFHLCEWADPYDISSRFFQALIRACVPNRRTQLQSRLQTLWTNLAESSVKPTRRLSTMCRQ